MLKLDASSGRRLGSVNVGPNPRHVAMSGDGATSSTSRASSRRRCPARDTATVQTAGLLGGEVVVVDAAGMTVRGDARSCCEHSDKPDFENQGRGVPNYLGAARHLAGRHAGLGAVEAGQHQARHAAQRREPQLPEHGARDQLAHRPRDRTPRTSRRASTTTTRASRARPRSTVRRLHVRRAGDEPRSGGRRRARPLRKSSASTSAARRRASRCRADGLRLYVNNFMDRTVGVLRPVTR